MERLLQVTRGLQLCTLTLPALGRSFGTAGAGFTGI